MNAKKKTKAKEGQVSVALTRRPSTEKLRKIAWSMGLRRMNRTRSFPDRPEIRGMIFKIKDFVKVTEEE